MPTHPPRRVHCINAAGFMIQGRQLTAQKQLRLCSPLYQVPAAPATDDLGERGCSLWRLGNIQDIERSDQAAWSVISRQRTVAEDPDCGSLVEGGFVAPPEDPATTPLPPGTMATANAEPTWVKDRAANSAPARIQGENVFMGSSGFKYVRGRPLLGIMLAQFDIDTTPRYP